MSAALRRPEEEPWSLFALDTLLSDGLDAYLEECLLRCAEWFRASGGSLFLRVQFDGPAALRATVGAQKRIPWSAEISPGEGRAGQVLESGEPQLLQGAVSGDISSSMIIPLAWPQRGVMGVMNLSRGEKEPPFDPSDLELVSALADQAALALSNALLLQESREAQAEVSRMKRMAEIGQMTASIAHEIRNPLTGIRSAAQMIQQSPEMADELAAIIQEEADRLNDLCTDFLDFAKPVAVNFETISLSDIAAKPIRLLQPSFDSKGVTLDLKLNPEKPTIKADASRCEQVVHNLLRNALQATEQGGRVTLEEDAHGFAVADDGCGMSPDQLERVFSPFFTTKADGTGLGLNMVQRIIEAHGWDVSVESRLGEGTAVRIAWQAE